MQYSQVEKRTKTNLSPALLYREARPRGVQAHDNDSDYDGGRARGIWVWVLSGVRPRIHED